MTGTSSLLTLCVYLAADAPYLAAVDFLALAPACFLAFCFFVFFALVALAGAEAAAPGVLGEAGACANETAAMEDKMAAAIRVLIFNIVIFHS